MVNVIKILYYIFISNIDPNIPFASCENSSTTAINLRIVKGKGNVQGYSILVDGKRLKQTKDNSPSLIKVIEGEPGTFHTIDVFAVHEYEQSMPVTLNCSTGKYIKSKLVTD